MSNDVESETFSLKEFHEIKNKLEIELTARLESEILCQSFEDELEDEESDLWDTPLVDSKTVIKLSPLVEKYTGKEIDPEWIKEGGYDSTKDAIDHLVRQLELSFEKDPEE